MEQTQAQLYFCDHLVEEQSAFLRRALSPERRMALRELQRLTPMRNLKALAFALLWGLCAALVLNTNQWVIMIPAILIMGLVLNVCAVFVHEAVHNLIVRSRKWNRWIGFFSGAPIFLAVSAYRTVHLLHHAHEGSELDPDGIDAPARRGVKLGLWYYLFLSVGGYFYLPYVLIASLRRAQPQKQRAIILEYALIAVIFCCAAVALGWVIIVKLWLLPLMAAVLFNNLRSLSEHALMSSGETALFTRTVISNRFVRFMLCNLNFHLEHHLFPAIPWYNLPAAHRLLAPEYERGMFSVYRSYTAFYHDFFRATRAGIRRGVRLVPREVLERVCL